MSATLVGALADQAQKFWAPVMVKQLKEETLLPSLVNRNYEGQLGAQGDTVKVSQIAVPAGSRKSVGSGHDSFSTDAMVTTQIDIKADTVITAAFELDNLANLQTQLGSPTGQSEIRDALVKSLEINLNAYLYSLVAPSTSAPDHSVASVTDFNASALLAMRLLAAQAKWRKDDQWYLLLDPSYMNDLLSAATLTSADYVNDKPIVGGHQGINRFGFNIFEDNSDGILSLSPAVAGADVALGFHRDFLHLVMQQSISFKISDKHVLKQNGYIVSAQMVVGGKLGLEGSVKHILNYAT